MESRLVILLYGWWIVAFDEDFAVVEAHRQRLVDEFYRPSGFVWSLPAGFVA